MMKVGCPHFRGEYRKYKQSNYTLHRAIDEFIDNIIKKCKNINLEIDIDNNSKWLKRVKISDDFKKGFENINSTGTDNPFNMSHIRKGQEDDEEISQFGIGMKAGAIAIGAKLDVITRLGNSYYRIEMDFDEMCEREDPDSYNPRYKITQEEYNDKHPIWLWIYNFNSEYSYTFIIKLHMKKFKKILLIIFQ